MQTSKPETPTPSASVVPRPTDSPLAHRAIRLADGRRLGFSDVGDKRGIPVFYFHGFPGSRLEATFFPVRGVRLVGIDRPGYGLSSPKYRRRLTDIAPDIEQLADALGFERFSLLGVSGGAPYAAACAVALPERVSAIAFVCGLGPPEAPGMDQGRLRLLTDMGGRSFARLGVAMLGRQVVLRDWTLDKLREARSKLPRVSADQELMSGALGRLMMENWREGLARSSHGLASDARIYSEPWPFALEAIDRPAALWHGLADNIVPPTIGQFYAAHVPGIKAHFPPEEGHLSVIVKNIASIGAFLVANA